MNILHFVSAPATSPSAEAFWSETSAALESRKDVSVYFFHEGATALQDPRLGGLIQKGARLFCCPRAAESFAGSDASRATLGGSGLLAELIERSSTYRSFDAA
jgi:hypothetical protein